MKRYLFFSLIILTFAGGNKNPRIRGPDKMRIEIEQRDIARVVQTESFLYCPRDMFLVASTIINRARSQGFPSSIREVVRQENQFQGFNNKNVHDPICLTVAVVSYWCGGVNDKVLYFSNLSKSKDRKHKNKLQSQAPEVCSPYHCFWGQLLIS